MKKPFAYISAAWSGQEFTDTDQAAVYCRKVYLAGFTPICPILYLPHFLNDTIPAEHKDGIDMARELLRRSHVLIVCGDEVDEAVKNDIAVAQRLGIIPSSKTCDIIHRSALFHLLILRRSHIRRRKMCRPKSFLLLSVAWASCSSLQPHISPDKVLWTISNPKLWAMDSMELHAGPQSRKSRKPMPMYRFGRNFGAKGKNSLKSRA